MVLSNGFFYERIQLDTINERFNKVPTAKEGDANGRGMIVVLTENGLVKNTTGVSLLFKWEHTRIAGAQGLEDFEPLDLTKGEYIVTYPTEMNHEGYVKAEIRIIENGKYAGSRNMKIQVEPSVGDDTAMESSNQFSALVTALLDVNSWNARIDAVEADFIQRANDVEATYPQELVSLTSQLAETDSRVSNIIASAGDGTNPSELSDIKVGNDGELYISAGDFTRAASEGRVPKSTLNEVWAHKHATATHTIITTPRIYNGRTLGVSATVTIVESNLYWYMRARLAGKVFNDIKTKKFRVTVRSDKDANIRIITMNGAAWGSEDGKLGSPESFDVALNAANKRETSVIFDFSKASYATFYAVSGRELSPYQDVYFSVAMNDGGLNNSAGVYNLSYEVSELVSDKFDDLTASRHVPSASYADSAANATNATNITGFTPTDYLKKNEINFATPLTVSTYGGSFTGTDTFSKTMNGLITRVTRPEVANPDL